MAVPVGDLTTSGVRRFISSGPACSHWSGQLLYYEQDADFGIGRRSRRWRGPPPPSGRPRPIPASRMPTWVSLLSAMTKYFMGRSFDQNMNSSSRATIRPYRATPSAMPRRSGICRRPVVLGNGARAGRRRRRR